MHYRSKANNIIYVSIDKTAPGQGLAVGEKLGKFNPVAKVVIVLDKDVDLMDISQVMFAVSSRWQPDPAAKIYENLPGPAAGPEPAHPQQDQQDRHRRHAPVARRRRPEVVPAHQPLTAHRGRAGRLCPRGREVGRRHRRVGVGNHTGLGLLNFRGIRAERRDRHHPLRIRDRPDARESGAGAGGIRFRRHPLRPDERPHVRWPAPALEALRAVPHGAAARAAGARCRRRHRRPRRGPLRAGRAPGACLPHRHQRRHAGAGTQRASSTAASPAT